MNFARRPGLATHGILTVSLTLALLACDLLKVTAPGLIDGATLNDPPHVRQLAAGAIADFECAYASYVVAVAAITDEMISSGTGSVTPRTTDQRLDGTSGGLNTCIPGANGNLGYYLPMSTARFDADHTMRLVDSVMHGEADRTAWYALMAAYAGYSYVFFGEGFCRSAFDGGPAMDPGAVLQRAEDRFTTAIDSGRKAGADSVVNLALVGRARVRLDLGKTVLAEQDAIQVPAGFVKYATYSGGTTRRYNRVYHYTTSLALLSVDAPFRNVNISGTPDPRVRVQDAGRFGRDGRTRLWLQHKYETLNDPIRIASWSEAQLIAAEAEGGSAAVGRINEVRALYGIAPFNSSDSATIAGQVREERRRELFLEGARLNDMHRFGIPLPAGLGTATCFVLPKVETDPNPNIP